MPNQNAAASNTAVLQIGANVFAYVQTVGGLGSATGMGFPTTDTMACPSVGPSACTYQIFTDDYALFAYTNPLPNGQLASRAPIRIVYT